ncbi:ammonium transporter Rh type A [Hydra vulgaris]|uniref:ammonium transporter Rh type A n=1 Tax=Hydra vulgaris TaxID=6087 RepID=UPI0006411A0B|nr:ammonium transporter Rh type A [Hydra vulgaris]XP_012557535.1 ammonium transporter Rh type A [Hydra vulgaris]
MKLPGITFPIVLGAFQILILGLFGGYVFYSYNEVYDSNGQNIFKLYYAEFQDIHVMMFVGFGFLMTFLKKYGYGAVSYNLLLGAITIQWSTLIYTWIYQNMGKDTHRKNQLTPFTGDSVGNIRIGIKSMINADYTVTAILISYGAVIGKASRLQLLVMMIIEVVFFSINQAVIFQYLSANDPGGSITLHLFGAYFGLSVSTVLRNAQDKEKKEGSEYHSDLFSMIGTLFLWCYWPSFNGGLLGEEPERQNRAIVNTYYSLTASVISVFVVSSLVNKKFKYNMVHIQNATIAGGVAIGTCADLMIRPWGAILIGILAGAISVIGFTYITPFLNRRVVHDTCGVQNLHGMPGWIGGITGSIAAGAISKGSYGNDNGSSWFKIYGTDRREVIQGCFQFAAIMVSFVFALGGGYITGIVISFLDSPDEDDHFDDNAEFEVPDNSHPHYPVSHQMSGVELMVKSNKNVLNSE